MISIFLIINVKPGFIFEQNIDKVYHFFKYTNTRNDFKSFNYYITTVIIFGPDKRNSNWF